MVDHVSVEVGTADRRRTDRCVVRLESEVHLPAGTLHLWTASVSAGGVFVSSTHVAPPGSALHLVIHLPGGPLESVATVVRALPGVGMGCRLSVPGAQERQRWYRFLETVLPPREVVLEDVVVDNPRALFDFTWSNDADDAAQRPGPLAQDD